MTAAGTILTSLTLAFSIALYGATKKAMQEKIEEFLKKPRSVRKKYPALEEIGFEGLP